MSATSLAPHTKKSARTRVGAPRKVQRLVRKKLVLIP